LVRGLAQEWLIELLKGTGKFFLHPIFYYLLFMAAVLGISRVKRERSNFHIRAENAYFELRQLLPIGLLIGLGISVITIVAGLVIPMAAVVFVALFTVLWSLTTKVRLLAPGYTIGFAFFATLLVGSRDWSIPLFSDILNVLNGEIYPSIAAVLALLVIGEGILILKNGSKGTSPKLIKSKRGQRVGVHEVKRVWMIPVFLLIPGSVIEIPFEWWPVFNVGDQAYSLLLVPFAVGFHQQVQGMLPKEAISILGKRIIALGIFLVLLSIGSYWIPTISIAVVALAIIGRELLTFSQRVTEENQPFYFSKRNHGVMILGIIPESPAYKMALAVGELITKVNGIQVHDEQGFYEALQRNRAHCKLEVIDTNGEIRFVQRALYEGDHHELGILFVQEEKKWDIEAV